MVAITVILAAVIAAFVFGMAGTTQTTKTVGLTVALNQSEDYAFVITFTGGADLSSLKSIKVNFDGAPEDLDNDKTNIVGAAAKVEVDTDPKNKINLADGEKFGVGDVLQVAFTDMNLDVSGSRLTLIGAFTDGGEQILYDRTL